MLFAFLSIFFFLLLLILLNLFLFFFINVCFLQRYSLACSDQGKFVLIPFVYSKIFLILFIIFTIF